LASLLLPILSVESIDPGQRIFARIDFKRETASGADLTFTTHKKAPEKPGLELGTFGRDRPLQPAPSRVNKPLTTISATKEIAPKTTIHNLAEYSAPACNLEATRPEKPNPVEKVLGASWRPQLRRRLRAPGWESGSNRDKA